MSSNLIVFAGLLSGVAGIVCVTTLRNLFRAKHSASWPTVDGTIIAAEVVEGNKGNRPKLVYRYQLAGRQYENDRIVVGWMWERSGKSSAQIVQRFAKGSPAAIAVDPDRPDYSVLMPGIGLHQIVSAAFAVIIFLLTLPLLWVVLQSGNA